MKLAVILTITLCCIALQVLSLCEVIAYPQKIRTQDVSGYENRFRPLKNNLPPSGVVGFVSDCRTGNEDPGAKIFSAQYALAPLIIVDSADYPLVIAFLRGKDSAGLSCDRSGLTRQVDLGNGVMLFRKETE